MKEKFLTISLDATFSTRRLIITVLLLQLVVAILISNPVSIVREAVCLFYLTFIPGLLILSILKIRLDFTETVLLSIGLSISSIMFIVAIFNVLSRSLGFEKPISEMPLFLLLTGFVLLLCLICYLRSKEFSTTFHLKVPLVPMLSLWLLPLSIYGAYQLIVYDNNVLLLLLYAIISLFPLLIAFNKIPKEIYPLIIWIISVSLLYLAHTNMNILSVTIMPGVVVRYGFWDPLISSTGHNSLLFNTIVHPTFFFICGFKDILSELKIVPLLISSFTPVISYQLFKKRIDERAAFMSSMLFMFFFWSYIPYGPRQRQAEFFLALLLLSAFNDRLNSGNRVLLSIVFALSLIASHYGTSYLFMFSLIFAFIAISLCKKSGMDSESKHLSSFNFSSVYLTATLAWYMYTAGSANFITLVNFYNFFFEHLGELFSPEASHALGSLTKNWNSTSIEILKYLMIFICGLIAVGVLHSFYRQIRERKIEEYLILSLSFLIMLVATLLPIGGGFDTSRIFHITLILLAPFSVIGLKVILGRFGNQIASKHLILFAGLLIVFFLLNSGFIAEFIPNDYSPNAYVNKEKIIASDNIQAKYLLYRYYVPSQDVQASEWIKEYGETAWRVYCDRLSWRILTASKYGQLPEEIKKRLPKGVILRENTQIKEDSYVFLAYHNTVEKLVFVIEKSVRSFNQNELPFKDMSKIYNNGDSIIYNYTNNLP